MPLTFADCKVGDEIVLVTSGMKAQPGARAVIKHVGRQYIDIEWHRDHLSADQNDGGYYPSMFEKAPTPYQAPVASKDVDYMKAVREICGSY